MLRQITTAILASALCFSMAASAQVGAEPGPGQTGYKRAQLTKFAGGFVNLQAQYGANIIGATFETALRRSRDTARTDSKPVPEEVIEALMPFYPRELFSGVRYSIGDTTPAGLAGFAIRNGNAAAVTLIDTIVFRDENYVLNIALWSHEMHHVEQYKDWGTLGFATRYAFGWNEVEAEAEAKANKFVSWYKERHPQ